MRKSQFETESVQLMDIWPPVELSLAGVPEEAALEWAEQRIIELKTFNLRFIRAMDIASVDPAELPERFSSNLEFFSTADGYLTVTLQMVRGGSCRADQVPALFKAVTLLAGSLGDARKQMLLMMSDALKREVVASEGEVHAGPEDVEEEMIEVGRLRIPRKRTSSTRV